MYSSYMAAFEDTVLRCVGRNGGEGIDSISVYEIEHLRLVIRPSISGKSSADDVAVIASVLDEIGHELSSILGSGWDISVEIPEENRDSAGSPVLAVPKEKWVG